MNSNAAFQGYLQSKFAVHTEEKTIQCTPDNPFGISRNPSSELKALDGIHYTKDPIAKQMKVLQKLQNSHKAAIGLVVAGDIALKYKAIVALWEAIDLSIDLLDYIRKVLNEMPAESNDDKHHSSSSQSNIILNENSERIRSFNSRQEEKLNDKIDDGEI